MLGHQLGEHFVLGLDLLLQPLDAILLWRPLAGLVLEGGGAVFKSLLSPAIENRQLNLELVAELRDRLLVHQMPSQNGDLLRQEVIELLRDGMSDFAGRRCRRCLESGLKSSLPT